MPARSPRELGPAILLAAVCTAVAVALDIGIAAGHLPSITVGVVAPDAPDAPDAPGAASAP